MWGAGAHCLGIEITRDPTETCPSPTRVIIPNLVGLGQNVLARICLKFTMRMHTRYHVTRRWWV